MQIEKEHFTVYFLFCVEIAKLNKNTPVDGFYA
jgi:hypothetical protein